MKETAKNFEQRVARGDFEKYLHGKGIDIGGGNDCLRLPPDVEGTVELWDIMDGDAQYMHKIKDETFDFVYSSHCLEHMRDVRAALMNWTRICKRGGVLYICVPHETYYEKGVWPSKNNSDHKWSFTVDKKSDMPKNIVVSDLMKDFGEQLEVMEIRENLMNYHYDWPKDIDQTAVQNEDICAQIDIIARKKDVQLSEQWRRKNEKNWLKDYWTVMFPIQARVKLSKCPKPVKKVLKRIRNVFGG